MCPRRSGRRILRTWSCTLFCTARRLCACRRRAAEREHPGEVVSRMQKALRKGKVLIDRNQNDEHKTTVNVYSLRAKEQPTVSTPVTWQEVESTAKEGAAPLQFTSDAALKREIG